MPFTHEISVFLITFIAILHLYFLILEMFLWTKPIGLKVFRMSQAKAEDSKVLAANQGLYNGFLAAGLSWGLFHSNPIAARQISIFFLCCVGVAGIYGGYSVNRRIFFIQGLPALIALAIILMSTY